MPKSAIITNSGMTILMITGMIPPTKKHGIELQAMVKVTMNHVIKSQQELYLVPPSFSISQCYELLYCIQTDILYIIII